jgi:general stress protein 26
METITIKVQTQAQAEMILAKIMELQTQEIRITTKYSPKKAKTKAVKPIRKKNPVETGSRQGLKELKLAFEGNLELRDAQEIINEIKHGK